MIHGQTHCLGAATVIPRVALNPALGTISSPGIEALTSSVVAPQRRCQGRTSGAVSHHGTAVTTSRIRGSSRVRLAEGRSLLPGLTDESASSLTSHEHADRNDRLPIGKRLGHPPDVG